MYDFFSVFFSIFVGSEKLRKLCSRGGIHGVWFNPLSALLAALPHGTILLLYFPNPTDFFLSSSGSCLPFLFVVKDMFSTFCPVIDRNLVVGKPTSLRTTAVLVFQSLVLRGELHTGKKESQSTTKSTITSGTTRPPPIYLPSILQHVSPTPTLPLQIKRPSQGASVGRRLEGPVLPGQVQAGGHRRGRGQGEALPDLRRGPVLGDALLLPGLPQLDVVLSVPLRPLRERPHQLRQVGGTAANVESGAGTGVGRRLSLTCGGV